MGTKSYVVEVPDYPRYTDEFVSILEASDCVELYFEKFEPVEELPITETHSWWDIREDYIDEVVEDADLLDVFDTATIMNWLHQKYPTQKALLETYKNYKP